jgi:hypothetical protein
MGEFIATIQNSRFTTSMRANGSIRHCRAWKSQGILRLAYNQIEVVDL